MPYEVNTQVIYQWDGMIRCLPEEIPENTRELEGFLFSYLNALMCLLSLVMVLMRICVKHQDNRAYVGYFLPVYDTASEKLRQLIDMEIREGMKDGSRNLVELVYAIRDGQIGAELVALDNGLSESEGSVDPEDHLDTATTFTNSLKEQIEKHTKRRWIRSVLHSLNEVISIVRGVV